VILSVVLLLVLLVLLLLLVVVVLLLAQVLLLLVLVGHQPACAHRLVLVLIVYRYWGQYGWYRW